MFLKQNDVFTLVGEATTCIEQLPPFVFKISFNDDRFFLTKENDKFVMPDKVYDFERDTIEYFKKTIQNNPNNTGILLNGEKGSGKSFTAKTLCNELNIPVIIIENFGHKNLDMFKFLTSIHQTCIFLIDEFEKKFSKGNDEVKGEQQQLLSFMDGMYNTEHKKIFILTTNNKYIDENLISRPSRIRYAKEFKSFVDKEFIYEFLKKDTNLNDEQLNTVVKLLGRKKCVTLDILSQVVKEVEIHGFDSFVNFGFNIFNLEDMSFIYRVTKYDSWVNVNSNGDPDLSIDEFIMSLKMTYEEYRKYDKKCDEGREKANELLLNGNTKEYKELINNVEHYKRMMKLYDNLMNETVESYLNYEEIVIGEEFDNLVISNIVEIDEKRKVLALSYSYDMCRLKYMMVSKPIERSIFY